MGREFWLSSLAIVSILLMVLFIRDVRRLKRREPIKIWPFLGWVEPDSLWYSYAAIKYFWPYPVVFFLLFCIALGLW